MTSTLEVKGTAVEATSLFVKRRFGAAGHDSWLSSLSEQSREILAHPMPSLWYPIDAGFVQPTKMVCDLFFSGDKKGAREIGRFSAESALRGIYKIFVRFGSPGWILAKGSKVFETYYRPCAFETTKLEGTTCVLTIRKFPEPSGYVEARICGWIERAFQIHGVASCDVAITRSIAAGDSAIEILAKWT